MTNAALAAALLLALPASPTGWSWTLDAIALTLAPALAISAYGLLRDAPWRWHALRISGLAGIALALVSALVLLGAVGYLGGWPLGVFEQAPEELTIALALALPYLALYPWMQLLWSHEQLRRSANPEGSGARAALVARSLKPDARTS